MLLAQLLLFSGLIQKALACPTLTSAQPQITDAAPLELRQANTNPAFVGYIYVPQSGYIIDTCVPGYTFSVSGGNYATCCEINNQNCNFATGCIFQTVIANALTSVTCATGSPYCNTDYLFSFVGDTKTTSLVHCDETKGGDVFYRTTTISSTSVTSTSPTTTPKPTVLSTTTTPNPPSTTTTPTISPTPPPTPPPTSSSLSTGAIVGIAIGSVAGVALIAAFLFWFFKFRKNKQDFTQGAQQEPEYHQQSQPMTQQTVYAQSPGSPPPFYGGKPISPGLVSPGPVSPGSESRGWPGSVSSAASQGQQVWTPIPTEPGNGTHPGAAELGSGQVHR